jgi:maltooligosyltrehalose trehalohydrolase
MNQKPLGALPQEDGVLFRVWAPEAATIDLVLEPDEKSRPLEATSSGYFEGFVAGITPQQRYWYRLDNDRRFPDPASRFQPEDVHGPSVVIDPDQYVWRDNNWKGIPQEELVFYELHVGTFTPEGTFDGVRKRLPYLRDLGITAIELMPVADFPGRWNWGYDQAALFAPSRTYGTPDDLRRLVDEAHETGLAVFLDVVYNHLGPDGAYAAAYAPFFTDKYQTPWGDAINFDDDHSPGVRHFFIHNARHWLEEYHIDGLRLDATFAIEDHSETHFLAELSDAVETLPDGPPRLLVAEDHRNQNILVRPRADGGYGLDAVWVDDYHHQVRNMTAGDTQGYFGDYAESTMHELSETIERGWYFDGRLSPTTGEPRGSDPSPVSAEQCVVCIQNHDQIGNRPTGNRLTDDISLPAYRAASALLLFLPQLPLLFMGQEWAASSPFQFFTDHTDQLGEQVREGRKKEFTHFADFDGEVPDPQAPDTFSRSKLSWEERGREPHSGTLQFYRDLLAIRSTLSGTATTSVHSDQSITVNRGRHGIIATIDHEASTPLPEESTLVWHSERDTYVQNSRPPEQDGQRLYFHRPGAVVFETRSAP